jgi:hypothetical protein
MDIDTTKLSQLMDDGKWEEAKKLLDEHILAMPDEEARSAAHLHLASMYVKIMNGINRDYLATLDDAIAAMKDLKKFEQKGKDEASIEEARAKLKSIQP